MTQDHLRDSGIFWNLSLTGFHNLIYLFVKTFLFTSKYSSFSMIPKNSYIHTHEYGVKGLKAAIFLGSMC